MERNIDQLLLGDSILVWTSIASTFWMSATWIRASTAAG